MPVPLRELDRWGRSVPMREPPGRGVGMAELWMTVSTKRPLRPPVSDRFTLRSELQTPELGLQVAIGQLFSQETEQRTEQPGLFQ
jgi:hypothetical protein